MDVPELDGRIHQPVRLRIMAMLYRNRAASFVWLRDALGLTDGNLASHSGRLVAEGLIEQRKALTAKGFQVQFRITPEGDAAFAAYVRQFRALVDVEASKRVVTADVPPDPSALNNVRKADA